MKTVRFILGLYIAIALLGVATNDDLPLAVNVLAAIALIALMIRVDRKMNGRFLWERFPFGKSGW